MFRALNNRNFRIFCIGQFISISGSLMQIVAINWLAYRLTHSPLMLGILNFARHAPIFALGLFTGPMLDRWHRHRVLIITHCIHAGLAFLLVLLIYSPHLSISTVIIVAFLQGCVNAVDTPGRHSFISDLMKNKAELSSAIPLDSFVMNLARLIGPSIGGLLIAAVDEGICFLINTICYLAATVTLLLIKTYPKNNHETREPLLKEIKEGIVYTAKCKPIWSLLILVGLLSLVGIPFLVLMLPIYAKDILQGGPQALGFLHTGWAIGAMLGALYLASHQGTHGFKKKILAASMLFGLSLVLFSQTKVLWQCLIIIAMGGFLRMVQMVGSNTLIQTLVDETMRGRVMTFFTMMFIGMAPFGNLLSGLLAERFGAPATVLAGGLLCLVGALFFVLTLKKLEMPPIKKVTVEETETIM